MQQEDYIKRQIDQLGQVLGKILSDLLGLKTKGQISKGIETADQALKNTIDLNIEDLCTIPTYKFMELLQANNKLSNENFEMLANILFLLGNEAGYLDKNNKKKRKLNERSLIIYEYLNRVSSTYSLDRNLKIDKIKNAL